MSTYGKQYTVQSLAEFPIVVFVVCGSDLSLSGYDGVNICCAFCAFRHHVAFLSALQQEHVETSSFVRTGPLRWTQLSFCFIQLVAEFSACTDARERAFCSYSTVHTEWLLLIFLHPPRRVWDGM